MNYMQRLLFGTLAVALAVETSAAQQRWTQFRGDDANPVAQQRLPVSWSKTENVEWSVNIPGRGWSSPIVTGNRVFVTSVVTDGKSKKPQVGTDYSNELVAKLIGEGLSQERAMAKVMERDIELPNQVQLHYFLHCIDLETGSEIWKQKYHSGKPPGGRHRKNSFASETPVTDGETVFVYATHIGLFAYSFDGQQKWKTKLQSYQVFMEFGTGTSPVLIDGKIIIVDDNEESSFIAAYDKSTGDELWNRDRSAGTKRPGLAGSGWTTPYIWRHDKGTEIVTVGPGLARSYDTNGNELWRLTGISREPAASSFAFNGKLLLNGGRNAPYYSIKPGARGDISLRAGERANQFIAWTRKMAGTYIPTPIAYQDALYTLQDKGILARYNLGDGRRSWKIRLKSSGADFTSSPWASDGKIFCLSEQGDTYVIKADNQFEFIGVNSLGEFCLATPAIVGNRLLLRIESKLYSIRDSSTN